MDEFFGFSKVDFSSVVSGSLDLSGSSMSDTGFGSFQDFGLQMVFKGLVLVSSKELIVVFSKDLFVVFQGCCSVGCFKDFGSGWFFKDIKKEVD